MKSYYRFGLSLKSTNLYTGEGDTQFAYLNPDTGIIKINEPYTTTTYIKIDGSEFIVLSRNCVYVFYDEDMNYISGQDQTDPSYFVERGVPVPDGAYYVRLCVPQLSPIQYLALYTGIEVTPIYSEDLALEYAQEEDQQFFRAKLSGDIIFQRRDYDYIIAQPFETTYYLYMVITPDNGKTYNPYHSAKFNITDCEVDVDDKNITVTPDTNDLYGELMDGWEKEYNLIELAPEIYRMMVFRRPMIQFYIPGDSQVTCFINDLSWQQETLNSTSDFSELTNTYHFRETAKLAQVMVTGIDGAPSTYDGLYVATINTNPSTTNLQEEAVFTRADGQYTIHYTYRDAGIQIQPLQETWQLEDSDGNILYLFTEPDGNGCVQKVIELPAYSAGGETGSLSLDIYPYHIFARHISNAAYVNGVATYDIPSSDLVADNRNYTKCIGLNYTGAAASLFAISNIFSDEPTTYGRYDNESYYDVPAGMANNTRIYPICMNSWADTSLWYNLSVLGIQSYADERDNRSAMMLKDSYPLESCISVLLKQCAPDIIHAGTTAYSQFLYSGVNGNPINNAHFKLFVTPKSNLLNGNYETPAQKAQTTLKEFLDMLASTYKVYPYIKQNMLCLEHISWFMNGGSYTTQPGIGYDLTQMINLRNGKSWAYGQNKYSFDKEEMPARYETAWMDDVTEQFAGIPVEVNSKYVQEDKVEDITVGNFTSDIDYIFLVPENISEDGFALLAAWLADGIKNTDVVPYVDLANLYQTATNGFTAKTYYLFTEYRGKSLEIQLNYRNATSGTTLQVVQFNGATELSRSYAETVTGTGSTDIMIGVADTATNIRIYVTGTASVQVSGSTIYSEYQLPIGSVTDYRPDNGSRSYYLQNYQASYMYIQPAYWQYDMPAKSVTINGQLYPNCGVQKDKEQEIGFPCGFSDPDTNKLINTGLGAGKIGELSVNLSSRFASGTLRYDTE
jgi:hypothetical protein